MRQSGTAPSASWSEGARLGLRAAPARAPLAAAPPGAPAPPRAAALSAAPPARPRARCAAVAAPEAPAPAPADAPPAGPPPPRRDTKVVIAGAGIGGLVLAAGLLARGFDVTVLERDLTAVRGEGKYRGPIQVQSNALAALEALHPGAYEAVMAAGCVTGDRVNGLCDGVTGAWYVKFDTWTPAAEAGLPVTRVVSRTQLQRILLDAVEALGGPGAVVSGVRVADFEETDAGVAAVADDGRRFAGDLLVGADGIWSRVRTRIAGAAPPTYSEYTCYTGIADWTPADADAVGYRVFLGNGQYFVCSDVGGGRTQWYGFHKEPAGGADREPPGERRAALLRIFGRWADTVVDLIRATPEADVMRRDIYDRPPVFSWASRRGRVALLGDSAHAMQPNLGQGGCMAIEDAFRLVHDLAAAEDAAAAAGGRAAGAAVDVPAVVRGYQAARLGRAAAIHGMAGAAAIMASTYKAYLGEGLGPLEPLLAPLRVPHPGRVAGRAVLAATMPAVLGWVLGGTAGELAAAGRAPSCRLADRPRGMAPATFRALLADDGALVKAWRARWLLCPADEEGGPARASRSAQDAGYSTGVDIGAAPGGAVVLGLRPGGEVAAVAADAAESWLEAALARVEPRGAPGSGSEEYVVHVLPLDARRPPHYLPPSHGRADAAAGRALPPSALHAYEAEPAVVWLNGRRLAPGSEARLAPGDELRAGAPRGGALLDPWLVVGAAPRGAAPGAAFKVKLRYGGAGAGAAGTAVA